MSESIDVSSGPIMVTVGRAYRLEADIHGYTASGKRRRIPVLHKGEVYVCRSSSYRGYEGPVFFRADPERRYGRRTYQFCEVGRSDAFWNEFVRSLVEVPHDLTTALIAGNCGSYYFGMLAQFVASGKVTLDDVVLAAKLDEAHEEALDFEEYGEAAAFKDDAQNAETESDPLTVGGARE